MNWNQPRGKPSFLTTCILTTIAHRETCGDTGKMKPLTDFNSRLKVLATDIDDTLTHDGRLGPEAYQALWDLHACGIHVIPVTGRPAGWCEMIARQWPVHSIVGENGAFYFRYDAAAKKMFRHYAEEPNPKILKLKEKILGEVPGCAIASDQFCRMFDLAIDFCEDVPALPLSEAKKIKKIFEDAGAQAKISSIHVNGWYGSFDKLKTTLVCLKNEFSLSPEQAKLQVGFAGDSPNDEPMFGFFPHSFAVQNFSKLAHLVNKKPGFLASEEGGKGFVQIASRVIHAS